MRLVDEVGTDLDGLSQLRALIASGRKPGILVALDFDFIEVETGRAVFAGTPGEHAYNPIGAVHGGVCRHTARLGVRLRGAFPPYIIAGLYDAGTEGGLSQADNQRHWASASGGQLAFVWPKSSVRRGQADGCARQIVRVRHLDIARFREVIPSER